MSQEISYEKAIAKLTGTRANSWENIDGPDTHCGVDYYFEHRSKKTEAYLNNDQGYITISVDGEQVFADFEEELPQ